MSIIRARVPAGIKLDQLGDDINMLLQDGSVSSKDLILWCEKIDKVTSALTELNDAFYCLMPQATSGHCIGLQIGKNRLLSMALDISETQIQFVGGVATVRKRVARILSRREKQRTEQQREIVLEVT